MLSDIKKLAQWFYTWTDLKIKIQQKETILYFREREVWWASLGANIGFEQNGKNQNYERPVLVLKKFNKDILWCLPMASRRRSGTFYYNLNQSILRTCLIVVQIRLISSKRLIRRMAVISDKDFSNIQNQIVSLVK